MKKELPKMTKREEIDKAIGIFTKRDQVIMRAVEDVLEDRMSFSFSLASILFAMVADGLSFQESAMDFGCVMFGEDNWDDVYELLDTLFITRCIEEDPKTWFDDVAEEVKEAARRVLVRQGN